MIINKTKNTRFVPYYQTVPKQTSEPTERNHPKMHGWFRAGPDSDASNTRRPPHIHYFRLILTSQYLTSHSSLTTVKFYRKSFQHRKTLSERFGVDSKARKPTQEGLVQLPCGLGHTQTECPLFNCTCTNITQLLEKQHSSAYTHTHTRTRTILTCCCW